MGSQPARLGGISLDFAGISPDFAGISPTWDENFPHEHAQVGQPGNVG